MSKTVEKAKHIFINDSNCAQSVLSILGPDYGLDDKLAYKLSAGLGGGFGYQGGACGAVIGAFMILGLEFGNQIPEDSEGKQITRKATNLFIEKFIKRHGSFNCPTLLNKDIRIRKEYDEARNQNLFNTLCPKFVQSSIELIEEVKKEIKEAGSLTYFEEISEDWDTIRQEFFSENIRLKAFAKAGIKKGSIVADIGAGSGYITEGLTKYDVSIKAIDQSPAMIEVMKRKFDTHTNIEFLLGDSDHLPLDNNTVDYAFCNMYLHHVNAPQKAINEIYRILKPGGKLIITDLLKHEDIFLILEQYDRWLGFDKNDLKKWFEKAGFSNVEVKNMDEDCSSVSKCNCTQKAQIDVIIAHGNK